MTNLMTEAAFEIPKLTDGDAPMFIAVEKIGGGTVGKRYVGGWRYQVVHNGLVILQADDLTTGIPHTHEDAALEVADALSAWGAGEGHGPSTLTAEQVAILEQESERLYEWANPPIDD